MVVGGARASNSDATQTIAAAVKTPARSQRRGTGQGSSPDGSQGSAGRRNSSGSGSFNRSHATPISTNPQQQQSIVSAADHRQIEDARHPQQQQDQARDGQPQADAKGRDCQSVVIGHADPAQQGPPQPEGRNRQSDEGKNGNERTGHKASEQTAYGMSHAPPRDQRQPAGQQPDLPAGQRRGWAGSAGGASSVAAKSRWTRARAGGRLDGSGGRIKAIIVTVSPVAQFVGRHDKEIKRFRSRRVLTP